MNTDQSTEWVEEPMEHLWEAIRIIDVKFCEEMGRQTIIAPWSELSQRQRMLFSVALMRSSAVEELGVITAAVAQKEA